MVRRNLYHAVIILGTEIHEVVVDGIHNLSLDVYFVVQVRTSTLARTAYPANDLTTYHFLAQLRPEIAQVWKPAVWQECSAAFHHDSCTSPPHRQRSGTGYRVAC